MASKRPIEDLDEKFHERLEWLESEMSGIAEFAYKNGTPAEDIFGGDFYAVQEMLAKMVGLPADYYDYMNPDVHIDLTA